MCKQLQTLLRGFLNFITWAESSNTTPRGGKPFSSSSLQKIPCSKQITASAFLLSLTTDTTNVMTGLRRYLSGVTECSSLGRNLLPSGFSLQLGFRDFQCWRWIVKCNICWISWLECKHFSVTFWGIWVQPQSQGTTGEKLFPVALLCTVTQLNRVLTALWLSFSTLCWSWMPATGNRNATLSLSCRKILPCAIWAKYRGPAGEAPVQSQENALIQQETGGELELWKKEHNGKR